MSADPSGLLVFVLVVLVLDQVVDTVLWGTTAYVIFRVLGGRDSRWYIGVFATFLIFSAYEYGLHLSSENITQYAAAQDPRVMQLLKDAIALSNLPSDSATSIAGIILSFIKIAIGFKVAQWVLRKRISNPATP